MAEQTVEDIVIVICLFGWLPIYAFLLGISTVIDSIKGKNSNHGIKVDTTYDDNNKNEDE